MTRFQSRYTVAASGQQHQVAIAPRHPRIGNGPGVGQGENHRDALARVTRGDLAARAAPGEQLDRSEADGPRAVAGAAPATVDVHAIFTLLGSVQRGVIALTTTQDPGQPHDAARQRQGELLTRILKLRYAGSSRLLEDVITEINVNFGMSKRKLLHQPRCRLIRRLRRGEATPTGLKDHGARKAQRGQGAPKDPKARVKGTERHRADHRADQRVPRKTRSPARRKRSE